MKCVYGIKDKRDQTIIYIGYSHDCDEEKVFKILMSRPDKSLIGLELSLNRRYYCLEVLKSYDTVGDEVLVNKRAELIKEHQPFFNTMMSIDRESLNSEIMKEVYSDVEKGEKVRKKISETHKGWVNTSTNTTGYYRVHKHKDKSCKQGFNWVYKYTENGKVIYISSVDLDKLEKKVKARGLEWFKIE